MAYVKCNIGGSSKYRSGNGGYAINGTKNVNMGFHPTSFVLTWMGKEAYSSSLGYFYTTSARYSALMNYNGTWKRQSALTHQWSSYGIQLPSDTSTFTSFDFKWDSNTTNGEILWVAY